MFNWNDIRVEQEIAQERYRVIAQSYQRSRAKNGEDRKSISGLTRDWLGNQLISLGCTVKAECQPV